MKVAQSIGLIIGANIGTSVNGWILCLSYIEESEGLAVLLSTTTITAVVAVVGIVFKMFAKRAILRKVGDIMFGFVILMVGMQMMSSAVAPVQESSEFTTRITMFSNPLLGIMLGVLI
jgi:phosphate:Na+ symporter